MKRQGPIHSHRAELLEMKSEMGEYPKGKGDDTCLYKAHPGPRSLFETPEVPDGHHVSNLWNPKGESLTSHLNVVSGVNNTCIPQNISVG